MLEQTISSEGDGPESLVTLGRIIGAHGVRGWVKLHSDTQPRQNILQYSPWWLGIDGGWQPRALLSGQLQGKAVIARLADCDDRDQAIALKGVRIAVQRLQLPDLTQPGEYYWRDLQGLSVCTLEGESLGHIARIMETGANDVLLVRGDRERLIPYLWERVIIQVDLDKKEMIVDWDSEF